MGRLTTHVLDASRGCPGSGIQVKLYRVKGEGLELLLRTVTNADGRCDQPLLEGDRYVSGVYQLHFEAGAYYHAQGVPLAQQPFLDEVVLRFGIDAQQPHYHVPLLLSPYSYSTYRGS
ncbi:hydroxyisourate hydrolase [Pseudomonas sp. RIT-PI-S]|uniref:hydroxyisourate hydrolase n=1 Tax=Pseudomonas sp. RIT-PI-S TaxID=3035295 RepID=UPI0021D952EC|nr:hydroxyisourate hydrolase [Pseudomonas sp. RIT-PI-S]